MRQVSRLLLSMLLIGLVSAFFALSASATVRYVDGENGDDSNSGADWDQAYKTIVDALYDAQSGDDIWVRGKDGWSTFDGVYSGAITLKDGVRIYGGLAYGDIALPSRGSHPPFKIEQWPNETIIDAGASGYAVTTPSGAGSGTVIDGFTIRNGTRGVSCASASPTVTHNRIELNSSAGVYTSSGNPVIQFNVIQHNSSYGVQCGTYCTASISDNVIRGNTSGGIYCTTNLTIEKNFVSGNGGYGLYTSGAVTAKHNTIAGNSTGLYNNGGSPAFYFNIVALNVYGMNHSGSGTPDVQTNCVYGNATDYYGIAQHGSDLNVDPKLGGLDYGELHIKSDSPCVNAVTTEASCTDIDGEQGASGGPFNIGADAVFPGTPPSYSGLPPITVMVDGATGNNNDDGTSWNDAKLTIQAGINAAAAWGGDVWVKEGTYDERVVLRAHVKMYGGFDGDETQLNQRDWAGNDTIIDPSSSGSAVQATAGYRVSRLDGFIVTGGSASNGGGVYCASASPIIVNNTISGNTASSLGGGIYCISSRAYISNNVIESNSTASMGGGIFCGSSYCLITGNVIRSNTCTGSGQSTGGGGMGMYSSFDIISNNLFTSNSADYGAGLYTSGFMAQAPVTLTNNTFSDNTGTHGVVTLNTVNGTVSNNIVAFNTGYGIYGVASPYPTLRNNDLYSNSAGNYYTISSGTGDISSNPTFIDRLNGDYHIPVDSTCVDTGYDAAVAAGSLDIDGEPRQVDAVEAGTLVDIGADEWYPDYNEDPMVDRGLPQSNLYNAAGNTRCNIRWADSNSGLGYGGSFTFLDGPAWQIDEIVVWTVPDMPMFPTYYLGDLYSNVSLYLGTTTLGTGPVMSGTFAAGANTTNNNHILADDVQYDMVPPVVDEDYKCADGTYSQLWKITFTNVNWTAPANTEIYFGVHGTSRVDRLWFNHATEGSGSLIKFGTTTSPVMFTSADGSGWFYGKNTRINVQVKAHPVLQ